ncbi:lytic murein transglycosylase [Mesorhizobium sp. B1-1-7]|nr:lytic murein transglycosylase [Mesorhizobium sp. B1-1-7]
MLVRGAPLYPAGHLPLKWGDWPLSRSSPISNVEKNEPTRPLPIPPLEGEMPGRAEGGNA